MHIKQDLSLLLKAWKRLRLLSKEAMEVFEKCLGGRETIWA